MKKAIFEWSIVFQVNILIIGHQSSQLYIYLNKLFKFWRNPNLTIPSCPKLPNSESKIEKGIYKRSRLGLRNMRIDFIIYM